MFQIMVSGKPQEKSRDIGKPRFQEIKTFASNEKNVFKMILAP